MNERGHLIWNQPAAAGRTAVTRFYTRVTGRTVGEMPRAGADRRNPRPTLPPIAVAPPPAVAPP
jgi:hypothetical protein